VGDSSVHKKRSARIFSLLATGRNSRIRITIGQFPSGKIAREGFHAMAGLRDRPLIRDALLAGGVIAASCVTALIAVDHSQVPRPHFDIATSVPMDSDGHDSAPAARLSSAASSSHVRHASSAAAGPSQQSAAGLVTSKPKSRDTTVVVMIPDSPRENPEPPPPGVWNDSGSASPVNGGNVQVQGVIANSSTGGVSSPLTSPTGGPLPSSPGSSGANPPAGSGPAGSSPPLPAVTPPNMQKGFVLVAGGEAAGQLAFAGTEIFNPYKNAFAAASSMRVARRGHTSTVLPGGRVLVAGGAGISAHALSSAELYDPVTGNFSLDANKMNAARAEHTATLISGCNCQADGKVLFAGGVTAAGPFSFTIRSAELYDPATGEFTATGSMETSRARHSATLITSGSLAGDVLIAGGTSDDTGGVVNTAELYDPVTGRFTPTTGTMSTPRENQSATLLTPSVVTGALAGKVLVAGGSDGGEATDSAEVFDPETRTFTLVGPMTTARKLQAAVLLDNGKVLIAGGESDAAALTSAELFDPAHATFAPTGSLHAYHIGPTTTALDDGSALIAGGASNSGDLYSPSSGSFAETGRMITAVTESTSALINR
jgi:hypothetical protein